MRDEQIKYQKEIPKDLAKIVIYWDLSAIHEEAVNNSIYRICFMNRFS